MKNRNILLLAAAVLLAANVSAQASSRPVITGTSTGAGTKSDKPVWTIGLSWAVVDDDGQPVNDLFNMSDSWNFLPYPSRLNIDMAIDDTWSFEGAFTYSKLEKGKVQNDNVLLEDGTFMAFDVNARYHFIKTARVFDPYGTAGLGFTYRSTLQYQTPTLNAGLGANIWFISNFGINLQTTVKFAIVGNSSSYMLHSAGLIYRLRN
jgi:OOP family OmpA-OmpF porin